MKRCLFIVAATLICFSAVGYAQVPVDSVAVKAASEQAAPAKKNKKKLTKEEKQRIKDLDAVVKTAKYKYTKEEKKQIDRLTILEQDLNDWLKDEQAEWYCVGTVSLYFLPHRGNGGSSEQTQQKKEFSIESKFQNSGNDAPTFTPSYTDFNYKASEMQGELWIKRGSRLQARVFYRGEWLEGQRWGTTFENGNFCKWRTRNDYGGTPYAFNLPEDIVDDDVLHPEYKEYNPWEYLIDLDKKAGKVSQKEMAREMNAIRKKAIEAKKAEQKKQKELKKAQKQAAKTNK